MKPETGEIKQLLPQQEDYRRGNLAWQKNSALATAKMRRFIAANPGCTTEAIHAACGGEGSLSRLMQLKLAKRTKEGWFVVAV